MVKNDIRTLPTRLSGIALQRYIHIINMNVLVVSYKL